MKLKFLLLFFIIFFSRTLFASTQTLTLNEAVERALGAHPTIAFEKEKTYELKWKVEESWVDFFPNLAVGSSYTDFENEDFRNWGIRLRYPLFEGGKVFYEYKRNKVEGKAAEVRVEITERKLILNVKLAYVNLLLEEKLVQAIKNQKDNLSKLFSIAESLFAAGKVPRSDLIRIKSELLESEGMIIEEERKRDLAQSVLLSLLNMVQTDVIEVDPFLSHVLDEVLPLEEALEIARSQRPEFREFEFRGRGLNFDLNVAKAGYWPKIYIDGQYGGSNNPLDHMGMRNRFDGLDEFWSVGINIEVDFWNWGKARTKQRQGESHLRQLGYEKSRFVNELSFEVKDAYLSWQAAKKNLNNAHELLDSSRQAFEPLLEDYQAGKTGNSTILETQNNVTQSQKTYEQAFFEVFNTEFKLEQALGFGYRGASK